MYCLWWYVPYNWKVYDHCMPWTVCLCNSCPTTCTPCSPSLGTRGRSASCSWSGCKAQAQGARSTDFWSDCNSLLVNVWFKLGATYKTRVELVTGSMQKDHYRFVFTHSRVVACWTATYVRVWGMLCVTYLSEYWCKGNRMNHLRQAFHAQAAGKHYIWNFNENNTQRQQTCRKMHTRAWVIYSSLKRTLTASFTMVQL
jgi:hypothetical protein